MNVLDSNSLACYLLSLISIKYIDNIWKESWISLHIRMDTWWLAHNFIQFLSFYLLRNWILRDKIRFLKSWQIICNNLINKIERRTVESEQSRQRRNPVIHFVLSSDRQPKHSIIEGDLKDNKKGHCDQMIQSFLPALL